MTNDSDRERFEKLAVNAFRTVTLTRVQFNLTAIALIAVFLVQTHLARNAWSLTFDETFYLNCARRTVQDGQPDKRLYGAGVAFLPTLLTGVPAVLAVPSPESPNPWIGQLEDPATNAVARLLTTVLIGIPLLLSAYCWMYIRQGQRGATMAGALLAFSPTIIAHSSLATTDCCLALFSLVSLAAISRWFNTGGRLTFVCSAISVGFAISSKYSGVFLFPVMFCLFMIDSWQKENSQARQLWHRLGRVIAVTFASSAVLFTIAFCVVWATDMFSVTVPLKTTSLEETPATSPWRQLVGDTPTGRWVMDLCHRRLRRPSFVEGIRSQWQHNREGHAAYLMGERSHDGWKWYFPCAWVFKSTPSELFLTLAILPLCIWAYAYRSNEDPSLQRSRLVLLIAAAVLWGMVLTARLNIGQRYLLPLYPLTILLGSDLVCRWLRSHPNWVCTVWVLIALQIASAVAIAPHYLSYFSPLIGGAASEQYALGDSNLDWGQDLPALRTKLAEHGFQRPLLAYYGTADPGAYGIEGTCIEDVQIGDLSRFDCLAISVTRLQGISARDQIFRRFAGITPIAAAGHSIQIYDLRNPDAVAALESLKADR